MNGPGPDEPLHPRTPARCSFNDSVVRNRSGASTKRGPHERTYGHSSGATRRNALFQCRSTRYGGVCAASRKEEDDCSGRPPLYGEHTEEAPLGWLLVGLLAQDEETDEVHERHGRGGDIRPRRGTKHGTRPVHLIAREHSVPLENRKGAT